MGSSSKVLTRLMVVEIQNIASRTKFGGARCAALRLCALSTIFRN
jgi:hypothetical protein